MARIIIEFSDNYLKERVEAQQDTLLDGSKEDVLMHMFDVTMLIGTMHELGKNDNEVVIKVSDIESLDCDKNMYEMIHHHLTKVLGLPALVATAKDKDIKTWEGCLQ